MSMVTKLGNIESCGIMNSLLDFTIPTLPIFKRSSVPRLQFHSLPPGLAF